MRRALALTLATTASLLLAACATQPGKEPMSFFITSTGSGKGADLGGLAGADALCQRLAASAGAGGKTWRAYLSVPGAFPSQANAQGVRFGERARPHRHRPLVQRQGRADRARRGPPAQRQHDQQGHRARREGQRRQGPRRPRRTSTTS